MRGINLHSPQCVQVYSHRKVAFTMPNETLRLLPEPHWPVTWFSLGLLGYCSSPGDKSLPHFPQVSKSAAQPLWWGPWGCDFEGLSVTQWRETHFIWFLYIFHLACNYLSAKWNSLKIKFKQAASKVKKILEAMSGSTMKLLDYTKRA